MDYIIKTGTTYFCGWDSFGNMKFVREKHLAYRMRKPVAENTLKKIAATKSCELEKITA